MSHEKLRIPLHIKLANILYANCFPIYSLVYTLYKLIFEINEINLIKKIAKPGMTVIDIGANIGFYTSILSRAVGVNGYVHAFEPTPQTFKYLKRKTNGLSNVIHNNCAVSSECGEAVFAESKDANIDNHIVSDSVISTESINHNFSQVKVVSLDDYCREINMLDLIKMDIQGYEYHVIKGMTSMLSRFPDLIIIMEFWPYGIRRAGGDENEMLNTLRDAGFDVYTIDGKKFVNTLAKDLDYVDLVITRRRIAQTIWGKGL